MNWKKSILLLSVLISYLSYAQDEQVGYVKTRGRMVDGRHIPGKGLTGAVVSIEGRNQIGIQKADGSFSFPVTERAFTIISVLKKDYVLIDYDALPRKYTYSSNPVYLVMEAPEQLLLDQLEAEGKIRKALQRQLENSKAEIERLKSQNKISEEEYRASLLKLYDNQSKEEKLIRDMAKRYSEIDYDQLDSFYREVQSNIENGLLAKTDSLLRSKGDLNKQIMEHLEQGKLIQEKENELQKAKEIHKFELDEMAQRCLSYHDCFSMKFQQDSAVHYLELRANLDTTNLLWQLEAGNYLREYICDYGLSMRYHERALRQCIKENGELHPDVATIYNNIALIYDDTDNLTIALDYHKRALEIRRQVYGDNHPDVANSYNNIGTVYSDLKDFDKAIDYHTSALEIWKATYGENHPRIALSYNNIGTVYSDLKDFDKAMDYIKRSLEIGKSLYGDIHQAIALSYNNIAYIYGKQGDYANAVKYHNMALDIRKTIFGENHPLVAISYDNLAYIYGEEKNYSIALEHNIKALDIYRNVYGGSHPRVAASYSNIGAIHLSTGNLKAALEYFNNSLEILNSQKDNQTVLTAEQYYQIGVFLYDSGNKDYAAGCLEQSLEIYKALHYDSNLEVATVCFILGNIYMERGDYANALNSFNDTLKIRRSIYGENHTDVMVAYAALSSVYSKMGDTKRELECGISSLNIMKSLLDVTSPMIGEIEKAIDQLKQRLESDIQ